MFVCKCTIHTHRLLTASYFLPSLLFSAPPPAKKRNARIRGPKPITSSLHHTERGKKQTQVGWVSDRFASFPVNCLTFFSLLFLFYVLYLLTGQLIILSVMEQELLPLLADTQSSVADTRRAAELHLLRLYPNESFPLSLTAIASYDSVPIHLRQSALSVLRTFIVSAWSPHLDEFRGQVLINDANKTQIRRILLELCTTADIPERKVKSSASYAVSKIASADFPDQWPELLPSLLQILNDPASSAGAVHGALKVLHDLVDTGFNEEQFFNVARDLVSTLFHVATSESRKPILRALAVSVFRSCFDTLEMVLEQHKAAVKEFMDEVLGGWSPFFTSTLKTSLPQAPTEQEEPKETVAASEWRGAIALKLQVVKVFMSFICFPEEVQLTDTIDIDENPNGLPRPSNHAEPHLLHHHLDRTFQHSKYLFRILRS